MDSAHNYGAAQWPGRNCRIDSKICPDVTTPTCFVPTAAIRVAIVCDNDLVRTTLRAVIEDDPELDVIGVAADVKAGRSLLRNASLQVLVVSLALRADDRRASGLRFITSARRQREDIGILSLKRGVEEFLVRAAIDAGADACCLAGAPRTRLLRALKAVSVGATWLDPEIAEVVFRSRVARVDQTPRLTARERIILQYITEGYTNAAMAKTLGCGVGTVHTHVANVYEKIGVHDRASAAVAALRLGLINENLTENLTSEPAPVAQKSQTRSRKAPSPPR
jgi:DNA-binding NarL/FixJ family response regulator